MESTDRSGPDEPHRAVAVLGTLMPHMAAERRHVYRDATALALLAALIAAAFGSLSIALVLTAVALPAALMTYIHDHSLWHAEPATVILGTFALSLLLGVGVGFLEIYFLPGVAVATSHYQLPSIARILELGVLVPVVAFVALLIAPMLVTARPAFRHPYDVVVTCALSGSALSLGTSVVVQHGAFTHVQATAGQPANVAFIALTLGFLQPIIFATVAAVAVLGLRSAGVNPATGVIEGLVLVVLYELASTLLQPYGTRGILLTTVVALVLAAAGLLVTRTALGTALAADVKAAVDGGAPARPQPAEHRLHGALVAAIVLVVVIVAAGVTVAIVGTSSTQPKPPSTGGVVPKAGAAASVQSELRGDNVLGGVVLDSTKTSLAAGNASTFDFGNGVVLAVAPGWSITNQSQNEVALLKDDKTAGMFATSGKANTSSIEQEASFLISEDVKASGYTNVQQDSTAQVQQVQGKNFNQALVIGYVANVQNSQGTMQIYGVWVTLFNASAQQGAFIDFYSNSQDNLTAAEPDLNLMLKSIL